MAEYITDELQPGRSAVDWAREHGTHYRGLIALTNHDPWHRQYRETVVDCYAAPDHQGRPIWVVYHHGDLSHEAVFIMDDGRDVIPWYVAGWHDEHEDIILHRFPRNFDDNGEPIRRANDGYPVNFDTWQLGPRRAYHVKLREA